MSSLTKKQGFSLIEILLAMVVFTIFSTSILYLAIDTANRDLRIETGNTALLYAREGLEAARNIRDKDYLELASGDYGLDFTDDIWSFTEAPETIDDFYQRTISIEDVYRDTENEIAEIGTLDPETKKITSEVTWDWRGIYPKIVSLTTYFTNWRSDDWLQTTCTEFDEGTFNNMVSETTISPPENNCAIELELIEQITEEFSSTNIGSHGTDITVDGDYAYVTLNSSSTGLAVVDVSEPHTPIIVATLNINGKGRYVTKDGDYLYIGVPSSSKGLAIVNVTNPETPTLVKSYNLSDYGNQSAVSGNYLYIAVDTFINSFRVIDITNKSNPTFVAGLTFLADSNIVQIDGSYAYVGTTNWLFDNFKIINITTPSNPIEIGGLQLEDDVLAIKIDGAFAYVGIENSGHSLQVINISDPENPTVLASLDVDGSIQDLALDGEYLYASTNNNGKSFVAINISNPLLPYVAYTEDLSGKGLGIDTDGDYIYMGLNVNNRGLVINEALSFVYTPNGEYVSDILDTNSDETIYNFIDWNSTDTVGGTIKFQIRTADTAEHMDVATWIGSDGTTATYYENPRTAIITDPETSGLRYFQFKAIITSDTIETPTIESVKINYTP